MSVNSSVQIYNRTLALVLGIVIHYLSYTLLKDTLIYVMSNIMHF